MYMYNPRFTGIHSSPKERQLQKCCVSFLKECIPECTVSAGPDLKGEVNGYDILSIQDTKHSIQDTKHSFLSPEIVFAGLYQKEWENLIE